MCFLTDTLDLMYVNVKNKDSFSDYFSNEWRLYLIE